MMNDMKKKCTVMLVDSCLGLQRLYRFLSISWSENSCFSHHVHLLIYGIEKIIRMENVKCMYINPFPPMSVRLVNFR